MEKIYTTCANLIRTQTGIAKFSVGVVMGSGLGSLLDDAKNKTTLPYEELPGFTKTGIEGHAGNVIAAEVNGRAVIGLQGRAHLYEGHSPQTVLNPIRTLKALGVQTLIQTNSVGSLHQKFPPGSLVMIRDHINLFGNNPLTGKNDDSIGSRFFDMTQAYPRRLREKMQRAAKQCKIELSEGVYAYFTGPNFETPAEINAMRVLGADTVGMSTVPETLAAVHAGLDVVAVSCVTNFAAGISENPLSHEETLAESHKASNRMCTLIHAFIAEL